METPRKYALKPNACISKSRRARRFRATSPIIGWRRDVANMGPHGALAVSSAARISPALRAEIDTLAAVACIESLTPVGKARGDSLAGAAGGGFEGWSRHQRRGGQRAVVIARSIGAGQS